jgi:GWxTD domain-containing protein
MSLYTPRLVAGCTLLALLTAACGGRARGGAPGRGPEPAAAANAPSTAQRRVLVQTDAVTLYRRLGLLAEGGETPFVGNLTFFAGRSADSTLMVLTVSLANRSLRFSREGDRYRSGYRVGVEVKRGPDVVANLSSDETVRVLAFRETQRTDESVLFRRIVPLAPGTYDLRLTVKGDSVNNGSAIEATIGVPRLAEGALSSPVAFFEATPRTSRDSLPRILATPRSTVVFGRDTLLPLYVEGYGGGAAFPLRVQVRPEGTSSVLWTDSVSLVRQGNNLFSGVIQVPLQKLGVGVMVAYVTRAGGTDTLRAPIFVAFGDDLPVATYTEMLDYLRYYVSAPRLSAMRDAAPEARARLWAEFIRDSDPIAETATHEGLRDYFSRMAQANLRFREEGGPGWLTDRGRAFVSLGTPDQILEPNINDLNQRGRTQIWEYRQHRLAIVFVDQTGFGRWRMTLSSETEFETTARRLMVQ